MKVLKVLAVGVTLGGIALALHTEKADAASWKARTVTQIKADMKGDEYTIAWGDTLSAISGATNITVEKLASMNKIANVDIIYAGNKLVLKGNVATVQNSVGETVAQSVIQKSDKVDPEQPIGQPVTETPTPAVPATPLVPENPSAPSTGNNGHTTTPTTPPSSGNTGNSGNTSDSGKNEQTKPSSPGENKPTTPSKPGTGDSGNGGDTGGSTTPEPEKPYALNPYTGTGTKYTSESAAIADGEKWMAEATDGRRSYTIVEEYWSDGSVVYYLELY